MNIQLLGLYAGGISHIGIDKEPSGIIKQKLAGAVQIGPEGIIGDVQANRRVHGGPEKALHHFAAETFPGLAAAFPAAADKLRPGSIGENISTQGLTEAQACIGDVFRLGSCLLQISQPRRPCWKIDLRYDLEGIRAQIENQGTTGWYYRVLETGQCSPEDELSQQEQPHPSWTILRINALENAHRPAFEEIEAASQLDALNTDWRRRFAQRVQWLSKNPDA
ncbi:MAG: MOSC domain-containing protein [Salinisphaeraceae bacterium]|nr:MOSC domain-containing protein [Salinisphaeraceae bacterium]